MAADPAIPNTVAQPEPEPAPAPEPNNGRNQHPVPYPSEIPAMEAVDPAAAVTTTPSEVMTSDGTPLPTPGAFSNPPDAAGPTPANDGEAVPYDSGATLNAEEPLLQ